jgi:hypothetical protein
MVPALDTFCLKHIARLVEIDLLERCDHTMRRQCEGPSKPDQRAIVYGRSQDKINPLSLRRNNSFEQSNIKAIIRLEICCYHILEARLEPLRVLKCLDEFHDVDAPVLRKDGMADSHGRLRPVQPDRDRNPRALHR